MVSICKYLDKNQVDQYFWYRKTIPTRRNRTTNRYFQMIQMSTYRRIDEMQYIILPRAIIQENVCRVVVVTGGRGAIENKGW
jgi:hypothetical protein